MIFEKMLENNLKAYYYETLGLSDYNKRFFMRLHEELVEKERLIALLKEINKSSEDISKMLVIGSGWGGMVTAAKQMGIDCVGIDPDDTENKIASLRMEKNDILEFGLVKSYGEFLPFKSNTFDLVYCFSVLEHVLDVRMTISEMSRVMKDGAYGFIQTPNYVIPYEGHYKLVLPTFMGKFIVKACLKLIGRKTEFIDTLNFISRKYILKLLKDNSIPQIKHWDILRHSKAPIFENIDTGSLHKNFFYYIHVVLEKAIKRIYSFFGIKPVFAIIRKTQ